MFFLYNCIELHYFDLLCCAFVLQLVAICGGYYCTTFPFLTKVCDRFDVLLHKKVNAEKNKQVKPSVTPSANNSRLHDNSSRW